jgi:hypothetical protein
MSHSPPLHPSRSMLLALHTSSHNIKQKVATIFENQKRIADVRESIQVRGLTQEGREGREGREGGRAGKALAGRAAGIMIHALSSDLFSRSPIFPCPSGSPGQEGGPLLLHPHGPRQGPPHLPVLAPLVPPHVRECARQLPPVQHRCDASRGEGRAR